MERKRGGLMECTRGKVRVWEEEERRAREEERGSLADAGPTWMAMS
jgi:hypothetical protein